LSLSGWKKALFFKYESFVSHLKLL